MALFKCKMCGGALEVAADTTVIECEYCGTKQTLPKLDDEKRANMYDRANHFRRNNDFDKAMGIYEQILSEDNTDAEAYWSLVLCRYGIEYVEDPTSHKRIPTVNRAQYTSILNDEDYKSALQYADISQRIIYEEEAKQINEIQKGILAISQKEAPFDVFICYKETDNNGRRTQDSVLAQELYYGLVNEGFKVFFSRITLEDKLGSAYEPYIFAALNSAKVMVALGTKPEYFNAVWVKNEWSRYLALIKQGQKKMLIPAYKDMDPYDLPEEFSHLQAQDMSKLGFMQDLIRGIMKIVKADEPKPTVIKETVVTASNATPNVAPLLKRAFMFLEDGDWKSADEYCEKVLDQDPENAQAYLGKLMAKLGVHKKEQLRDYSSPFYNEDNYLKVMRFGDDNLKAELLSVNEHIETRNEKVRLKTEYNSIVQALKSAKTEAQYIDVANRFAEMGDYKDAKYMSEECFKKAEAARLAAIYKEACLYQKSDTIAGLNRAISLFNKIPDWKDTQEIIRTCEMRINQLKAEQEKCRLEEARQAELERILMEQKAKKRKRKTLAIFSLVLLLSLFLLLWAYTMLKSPLIAFSYIHFGWVIAIYIVAFIACIVFAIIFFREHKHLIVLVSLGAIAFLVMMIVGMISTNAQTIEISSVKEFEVIANLPKASKCNYELTNDIDFEGNSSKTYGSIKSFKGVFDGNGYYIKNLNISKESVSYRDANDSKAGPTPELMGFVLYNRGQIINLGFKNCTIETYISGDGTNSFGVLAGQNDGLIDNCVFIDTYIKGYHIHDYYSRKYSVLNCDHDFGYIVGRNAIGSKDPYTSNRTNGKITNIEVRFETENQEFLSKSPSGNYDNDNIYIINYISGDENISVIDKIGFTE